MIGEITFRPIDRWPRRLTAARRRSPFRANYSATMKLLRTELGKIRADAIAVQLTLDERDIRNDGMPRADARPSHPGVILSFTRNKISFSFPCDAFVDWQDNVRAIALSLEALRQVDRYGVTSTGEQYSGWKQLPSGAGQSGGQAMSVDAAATFLERFYPCRVPNGGGAPPSRQSARPCG